MSHDSIAHSFKEGGLEVVPCKNAYEANELLPIDELQKRNSGDDILC